MQKMRRIEQGCIGHGSPGVNDKEGGTGDMLVVGTGTMGLYLVAASLSDIKTKHLKRWFLVLGIIPAVLLRLGMDGMSVTDMIGGVTAGLFFVVVSFLSGGKFGKADGILLLYLGAALGFTGVASLAVTAFFLSAFVMSVLLLMKKIKPQGSVPFVPFLLAAYIQVMFMVVGT